MPFPPELDLVVACCRWPPSPGRDAAVRARASVGVDWEFFARIAARQRVEGLVHHALGAAGVMPPPAVATCLAAAATDIARRNLLHAGAAVRLNRSLEAAGITFLFVKGVTLDMLAYRTLALKRAWDVDLVVEPEGYDRACALLAAAGYDCTSPGPGRTAAELRAWTDRHKHTAWTDANGVAVELHAALVDNPLLLRELSVHSPRQQVALAPGMTVPTLAPDALYAYLCVHGAAHAWSRLKWIADLHALVGGHRPAELARLHAAAESLGAGRCSAQALLLCAELFDISLDAKLEAALRRDPVARWLVRAALASMHRGGADVELDSQVLATVPIHLSHFALARGWRYKAAEARRKLFPAGDAGPLSQVAGWLARRVGGRRNGLPLAKR